jgi:hypothetical protein
MAAWWHPGEKVAGRCWRVKKKRHWRVAKKKQ